MAKQGIFSSFNNMVIGIAVEIFATLILMGIVFVIGFLILAWFGK